MNPSYTSDLTPENEDDTRCVHHADRRAKACDLDPEGNKVPLCEACWHRAYPRIRDRLLGRGLIIGGVKG